MSLKKRIKTDVSILDENLPLNNIKLYEQNNLSLKKTLEQYRKDNESLNSNNLLLSRKNDVLEYLFCSITSLWDSLNNDVDVLLSQQVENKENTKLKEKASDSEEVNETKNGFWEKMMTTKFPFLSTNVSEEEVNLDEVAFMFDKDEFLLPESSYYEKEWENERDNFLKSKVDVFDCKKEALLKSLRNTQNGNPKDQSGLVTFLKYSSLNYGKLFYLVYERYKDLKSSYNGLKVEVSRLSKQNSFLKFELKSFTNGENKKDPESSSTSSESDSENSKVVENPDEVTDEMVVGSSLYLRLFNYAKNMDKEIARLESENSELRNKVANLSDKPVDDMLNFKTEFDSLSSELKSKVESFESKFLETSKELCSLKENFHFVDEELEQYKLERQKLVEELNKREISMTKLLHQNASICKSLSLSKPLQLPLPNTNTSTSTNMSTFDVSSPDNSSSFNPNPSSSSNYGNNSNSNSNDDNNSNSNSNNNSNNFDNNINNSNNNNRNNNNNNSNDDHDDDNSEFKDNSRNPNYEYRITDNNRNNNNSNNNSNSNNSNNKDNPYYKDNNPNFDYESKDDSRGSKRLLEPSSVNDIEFYKEQLLNISEELEEVSLAFESKQKMCNELMRQLNEVESTRQKLLRTEASYNDLLDRFNKLVSVTNSKVSLQLKQSETLEKLVTDYKGSWVNAYNRACYLQHQRDVAQAAICELQSQYRRSVRSQKSLQDYLTLIRTGVVRTSSMDTNLGDVDNVIIQENTILRRRMICSVCSENFRDHVITKCGHVFCHGCITSNIKSRNRKCPQCKIPFDRNDTQRLFLD